jgi:hypothetical protein
MDYYSNNQNSNLSAQPVFFGMNESVGQSSDFTVAAEAGVPAVVHVKTQYNQPNYTLYDFILEHHPDIQLR